MEHIICIFDDIKIVKMRNIFSTLLICLVFFSCSSDLVENKSYSANTSSEFSVSGMMCERGCKSYLTNQIGRLHGVVDCEINFSEKKLTIDYNNNEISVSDIVEEVEGLMDGKYSIKPIKLLEIQDAESNLNTNKDNNISVVDFGFKLPNLSHLFSNWL